METYHALTTVASSCLIRRAGVLQDPAPTTGRTQERFRMRTRRLLYVTLSIPFGLPDAAQEKLPGQSELIEPYGSE